MRPSRIPATFTVVILIVLVFITQLVMDYSLMSKIGHRFPLGNYSVDKLGGIRPTTLSNHDYWQLVAAMFLHFGFLHVLTNLWGLYQLGGLFEILFGSRRFLLTYFVSGLIASFSSAYLGHADLSAGASGAIFGILGALIFSVQRSPRWKNEPWAKSLFRQLIGWVGLNIFIGVVIPGIDNFAHMGGFISGLLLGFLPHRVPPPPPREAVIDAQPIEPS